MLTVITAAAVLSACSSSGGGQGNPPAPGSSASPGGATKSSADASALTPSAAIAKFKAAGLPVSDTYTFTAANDPNHLLGRPNGYVAKEAWTDSRINQKSDPGIDTTQGNVDLGGSIEEFSSASEAKARAAYIATVEKALPATGTEYDYVIGSVLVRVSRVLTPSQARSYEDALK